MGPWIVPVVLNSSFLSSRFTHSSWVGKDGERERERERERREREREREREEERERERERERLCLWAVVLAASEPCAADAPLQERGCYLISCLPLIFLWSTSKPSWIVWFVVKPGSAAVLFRWTPPFIDSVWWWTLFFFVSAHVGALKAASLPAVYWPHQQNGRDGRPRSWIKTKRSECVQGTVKGVLNLNITEPETRTFI